MELQYKVKGADGKEYGPATLEQVSEWIQQGRLPGNQEVRRSDMDYWAPAQEFQELMPMYSNTSYSNTSGGTATVAVAPKTTSTTSRPTVTSPNNPAQIKTAGSWFYWVAGLSLVNSIAAFSGWSFRFILGLGVTQVIDGIGSNMASGGKLVALLLELAVAGVFIVFGVFATKGNLWAFIVGMILFALDGVILLVFKDWLGVGFHVFVLYCLFRGVAACKSAH